VAEAAYHVDSKPQFDSHFSRYSWLADSGTTSHICNDRALFTDFKPLEATSISGIGNVAIQAMGRGTVLIDCQVGGEKITHRLKDTLFSPRATNNLICISRLDDAASFKHGKVRFFRKDGKILAGGEKTRRLYLMKAAGRVALVEQSNAASEASIITWDS
jgi:hypothetical protein